MTLSPVLGQVPEFTLGDRLRKAREVAGYDRKAFAELLGVDRGAIARYETDQVVPRPLVLRAIAHESGIDIKWLRDGETPRPEGPGGGEPPAGIEPATYSLLGSRMVLRRAGAALASNYGTLELTREAA